MKCFRRCSKMKLFIIAKIVCSRKRNRLFVCSIVLFLLLLMSRLEVRNFTYNCGANAPNQLSHIEGFGQVNIDRVDFQNVATPLVWIGGIPKSGSSLVQSMLNLHTGIRCLNETRVLTRVLSMHRALGRIGDGDKQV